MSSRFDCVGVLTMLDKRGLAKCTAPSAPGARTLLRAGCGNGEGHDAPVYAKQSVAPVFVGKHHDFVTFSFKTFSGALGLGASWAVSGCFLSASLDLLGVSWVLLGAC